MSLASSLVQKRIKLLENRLERAYVKFNSSITHNKQLREQINNLRRERIMFESIHGNLERELVKVKKDMAETIQLANQVSCNFGVVPFTMCDVPMTGVSVEYNGSCRISDVRDESMCIYEHLHFT